MKQYTVGTGFSGIGVPDLVARLLGMKTVWQIEKEPFCKRVLHRHFPEAALYGDIFDCRDLPYVDIGVFGFPCQPFSTAGKQLGDHDPRYLVPEMLRVIDEVRPRILLLENVPAFTSLDDGKSFKSLLGALAEMGFDAEWGHLRASDVGAPHQRERWFCVGYSANRIRPHFGAGDPVAQFESEFDAADRAFSGHSASRVSDDRRPHARSANGMVNAYRAGWREQCAAKPVRTQQPTPQCAGRRSGAKTESRLGRNLDGVTCRMDGFVPYPARPGQPQFAFEPPRITTRNDDRAKRLKALGNSMAVDVIFEIMLSIRTYLETIDAQAQL